METSGIISAFALLMSIVSLGFSIYFGLRDRSKIKTECVWLDKPTPTFRVKAVNVGRRAITLYGFGATYSEGSYWMKKFESYEMHMLNDQPIEKEEHGRKLLEYDYFEEEISIDHDFFSHPFNEGDYPISLWLQDTSGRKYKIKHSEKELAELNKRVQYIRTMKPNSRSNKKISRNLTKKQ